ncbi:MAG TPA: tetratricopeptide repeat protein [Rhizomicrobium sp.]|jgi:Flp pilus assembly protein TadD
MPLPAMRDYEDGLRLSRAGRHAEAIGCFERALQHSPDDSKVLFALGNTARSLGLPRPAEDFYRRVLAIDPQRMEALVNLANLLRGNGQFAAAAAVLEPALARNPDSPELWLTLGSVCREAGDKAKAAEHYAKALDLRPDYPAALVNLADLLAERGECEDALALYDRAIKRDPHNAQAKLNRAILHLQEGNLAQGWRDYAARLKIPGKAPTCDHKLPRWNGASLKRARLLVTAEQGVGDELMFASVIPDLARRAGEEGGSLVLECDARLVPLFARSFPGVTVKPTDRTTQDGKVVSRFGWLRSAGGANAAIEAGSVPQFLRSGLQSFPDPHAYLVRDAEDAARWRETLTSAGPAPLIGICWRSGKIGGARNVQYAPLEIWGNSLRDLPGTIVCAQYDAAAAEIGALESASGRTILVPDRLDQKNELDRTCAMLAALDVVVSAPTAVSWLAAGAGVPTLKVLYDTSWTSFGQDREPFAPSCRLMMPARAGDWADVFAKTSAEIRALPARP